MLTPKEISPASYNPRMFTEENFDSLDDSMLTFGDISGITFNVQTGNLVTGHNRWKLLCQQYSVKNLTLVKVQNTDTYLIMCGTVNTTYTLREVDWTRDKEKLANVTANSDTVSGFFTDSLKDVLSSVSGSKLSESLRLNEIKIPKVVMPSPATKKEKKPKKSTTMISGGGETYVTVKLELTPEVVKEFNEMLDKFKVKGESVEAPLKRVIKHMKSVEA